jgi:mRNA interferase RelE/StbE
MSTSKTYRLGFVRDAKKEWDKLGAPIREQFKKALAKRLENPRIEKQRLSGMRDCYKIKLRDAGYRLVYKVVDDTIEIRVISIGRRDGPIYEKAANRQDDRAADGDKNP